MFRIGILGSDNSHALAFSKLCNIADADGHYLYDDVRITAIYGRDDDPAHTVQVAEEGKIEFIAEKPDDFFGRVDAVMVVYRNGSYHVQDALPFLEKRIPVWIDKPIASSTADIDKLRRAWQKRGGLISGGSTIKYNYDILTAKNRIESGFFGSVLGGCMNFPGDFSNRYEGLYFYGSHLVEMMLTVFGYNPRSLIAAKAAENKISVIVRYDAFQVVLNFVDSGDYFITVYGDARSLTQQMDISVIYRLGFDKFVDMLRSGRMPLTFDDLVKPVYILDAIYKSVESGGEILL